VLSAEPGCQRRHLRVGDDLAVGAAQAGTALPARSGIGDKESEAARVDLVPVAIRVGILLWIVTAQIRKPGTEQQLVVHESPFAKTDIVRSRLRGRPSQFSSTSWSSSIGYTGTLRSTSRAFGAVQASR
jgi:hypothetical protein